MANPHNTSEDESWIKTIVFHFPEAGLIVGSYFLDVILDTLSTVNLWEAQQIWWFSVSTASIIIPEILISIYITMRLYRDNIKNSSGNRSTGANNDAREDMRIYALVNQKLSGTKATLLLVLLCCATPLMVLPTITLLSLSFKYYRAMTYKSENNTKFALQITYELMRLTAMEALFQAVPQMSLSSYIVLHTVHCFQLDAINATNSSSSFCWDVNMEIDTNYLVTFVSAVISLTTLCFALSGFEYKKKIQWLRRFGYFSCFFMAIAARITVNGVIGSWYSVAWFAPPAGACSIALIGRLLTVKVTHEELKATWIFDLLYHILFGGLLLAIPTIYGILVCLSYIGWAVWFYIETEVDIKYEALALSVIMQFVSMAFVYILGSPFPLESVFFREKKSNNTTNNQGTGEVQEA